MSSAPNNPDTTNQQRRGHASRWELAVRNMATFLVGPHTRFDPAEIVEMVRRLAKCDGNGDPIEGERMFVPSSVLSAAVLEPLSVEVLGTPACVDKGIPVRTVVENLLDQIKRLKATSVTKVMVRVVPGADGGGQEVYAQSVDEVETLLGTLGSQVEMLKDEAKRSASGGHTLKKCTCGQAGCQYCDGGLAFCTVCYGGEAELVDSCLDRVVKQRDDLKEENTKGRNDIESITKEVDNLRRMVRNHESAEADTSRHYGRAQKLLANVPGSLGKHYLQISLDEVERLRARVVQMAEEHNKDVAEGHRALMAIRIIHGAIDYAHAEDGGPAETIDFRIADTVFRRMKERNELLTKVKP